MAFALVSTGYGTADLVGTPIPFTPAGTGHLIIVAYRNDTPLTVTDNLGSTYTNIVTTATNCNFVAYLENNPSGITSISVTSLGNGRDVDISEWSGAKVGGAFDQSNGLETGSGTPISGPALTTTQSGELLYSIIVPFDSFVSTVAPSTLIQNPSANDASVYQITGAPGSYSDSVNTGPSGGGRITSLLFFAEPSTDTKKKASMFLAF